MAEIVGNGVSNIMDSITSLSASVVDSASNEEQKESGCPNCDKDITLEEIKEVFKLGKDTDLSNLLVSINTYRKKFSLDTCAKKAHFFAQVLAEIGTSLNLSEPEEFNYSVRRLKGGDYIKGTNWIKGNISTKVGGYYAKGDKENWKTSPFSYFKKNPKEAELYGRKDLNSYNDKGIQSTNTKAIANIVYDDKNRDKDYKLGNVNEGDGYKFMGKGIIQITGRSNYTEVNKSL